MEKGTRVILKDYVYDILGIPWGEMSVDSVDSEGFVYLEGYEHFPIMKEDVEECKQEQKEQEDYILSEDDVEPFDYYAFYEEEEENEEALRFFLECMNKAEKEAISEFSRNRIKKVISETKNVLLQSEKFGIPVEEYLERRVDVARTSGTRGN